MYKLKKVLWTLSNLNICKTIYLNFKLFPLHIAVKFPILAYNRLNISVVRGGVSLGDSVTCGMVRLGYPGLGIVDTKFQRTFFHVHGTLDVKGKTIIGAASHLEVAKGAMMTIGRNFRVTGKSTILCTKHISFGNDCLLSWDILMMDTDWHKIIRENTDIPINPPSAIRVGNHVWIGCRNTILKGVTISDDCVIAAGSMVTCDVDIPHAIYGGSPLRVLKGNVDWSN